MITLEQYLMGRHVDYPQEYLPEYRAHAEILLMRVNALLAEIGELEGVRVSSGFRPVTYNKTVKGAARGSKHTTCQAVDIADPIPRIGRKITRELLKKHGLWMEHPSYTPGWIHLQSVPPSSGSLVFIPY